MNSKLKLIALFAGLTALNAAAYPIIAESGDAVGSAYTLTGFTLTADAFIEDDTTKLHTSVTGHNNIANDIDWYMFTAFSGGTIILDIDTDNWSGLFDSTMALWDSSGGLLQQSDDNPYDPGSTTTGLYFFNSRIYHTATYSGAYFVSVTDYSNFADGMTPFGTFTGGGFYSSGDAYDLHVSVPDAASTVVLMGLGMLLIGLFRSKRNLA